MKLNRWLSQFLATMKSRRALKSKYIYSICCLLSGAELCGGHFGFTHTNRCDCGAVVYVGASFFLLCLQIVSRV